MKITFPSIYPVSCHTDHIGPGSTFVAIPGTQEDGSRYIPQAVSQGASVIIIQKDALIPEIAINAIKHVGAELIYVENARKALAELSAAALGFPAKKLRIIGITGTKGKSTTAFLTEHILKHSGYKTALLSTIKNRILTTDFPAPLTTAQPDYLHVFFKLCVDNSVDYVVMEVAAQASSLHRVYGIRFDSLLFTNFSREHGEFYASMDRYFEAKALLCEQLETNGPLFLNRDDQRVWNLADNYGDSISFGVQENALFRAECHHYNLQGIQADIWYKSQKLSLINAPSLCGVFNVYNIIAATALAYTKNISCELIAPAVEGFPGVPGRLERFLLPNGALAFIDYAHNPSSFQAVLSFLRPLSKQLVVVFGAGGDRDRAKRPVMGGIASALADKVILTTDNPRSEDLTEINNQIIAGIAVENLEKVDTELDREKAIKKAYGISNSETVIALLGKGPDEYQLVKGVKTYFSEAALLRSF